MKTPTHYIGYRLHKDNSPVVVNCHSEQEQTEQFNQLKKEGYKPVKLTLKQSNEFLDSYTKNIKPRQLTQQERWCQWAITGK